MNKEFNLTKAGLQELKDELEQLKARRVEVAERLKTARDYGDLSENAEYHSARDEQAALEVRVKTVKHIINNAKIINNGGSKNTKASLGSSVVLTGPGGDKNFTIVGSVEANPLEGRISDESPIGKNLVGKQVGDEVEISLPNGTSVYKVKAIS